MKIVPNIYYSVKNFEVNNKAKRYVSEVYT